MPAAVKNKIKTNVIKQWLDGETRDKIATDNKIGAGTASGIINEFKKGVDALEYESIRELSISCKKQGTNLSALASSVRLNNYIQKLGANQEQIETFITDVANSPEPKKLIEVANQIAQISTSESIPLEELGNHIKQQQEAKQRLEQEIKQRRAILESTNVDIMTLNEYRKLKEGLDVHGLSLEDPRILLSILKTIKEIGYEPQKIVKEFSRIKSLRQTERQLDKSCKSSETNLSLYKEVLPWCEEIVRLGIRNEELLTYHIAVCEKAEMHKISREAAAYRVIEDIRDYNKMGGMKKQLNDILTQIQTVNIFSARQKDALYSLMKLQFCGVTDKEVLNIHEFLNNARSANAREWPMILWIH